MPTMPKEEQEENKLESSSEDEDDDLGVNIIKGYAKLNQLRKQALLQEQKEIEEQKNKKKVWFA